MAHVTTASRSCKTLSPEINTGDGFVWFNIEDQYGLNVATVHFDSFDDVRFFAEKLTAEVERVEKESR